MRCAEQGQLGQQRGDERRELTLVDERLQVGVGQQVAQLVLDVAVVDVDPDGPQLEDGPGGLDPLDRVVGVDPDVVPRPDPLGGQVVGQLVGPRLHLGVGAPLAVGDEVLPFWIGVDGRLEQVGEVELHRSEIRTGSRSCGQSAGAVSRTSRDRHPRDLVPEGLEGHPASNRARRSGRGCTAPLVVDEQRRPGRLGQELGLARTLHRDEPPRRLVDRAPDREQPVVAVNGGFVGTERCRQSLGGGLLEDDGATALLAHGVVLVEDARVLGDRVSGRPSADQALP